MVNKIYLACAIIAIVVTTSKYSTTSGPCSCNIKLNHIHNDYVLVKPKNMCPIVLPNNHIETGNYITSSNSIMGVLCNDDLLTFEKPKIISKCKYFDDHTCSLYNSFKVFFNHVVSYIIVYLVHEHIVTALILMYAIFITITKNKLRVCHICNLPYILYHNCNTAYKLNGNKFFMLAALILHIFSYKVSSVQMHSVLKTGDGSLVTFDDHVGLIQQYDMDGSKLQFQLISTTLVYESSHLHDLYKIVDEPFIEKQCSVCEPKIEDCVKSLGGNADYAYSKLVDKWSCALVQLKVCFICSNNVVKIGSVFQLTKPKIVVDYLETIDGIKTNTLNLDKRNSQYFETMVVLVTEKDSYEGNICMKPDLSCYGKHIKRSSDTDVVIYKKVEIIDMPGQSYTLKTCGVLESDPKNYLRIVDGFLSETKFVKNINLGSITFNINKNLIPDKDICNSKANLIFRVDGCYSCHQGYKLIISHDCMDCCKNIVKINGVDEMITTYSKAEVTLRRYSDNKQITVDSEVFQLSEPEDYHESVIIGTHYHYPMKSLIPQDIEFSFPFIRRIITIVVLSFLTIIVIYSILNSCKLLQSYTPNEVLLRNKSKNL
ncbi:putative glycoprotein precursor [Karaka Okahu purepure emaravirus]|uniref:Glycoprotein n=1 Tax=Karaka Okahu purepure emaravirus TaxID=2872811 RepID=A0AAX1PBJ3_9VIRU|nr:putative glycoprotein precursor [Karaka Okahu purepure emaravirus]QZN83754.1 putative glycoprotein precursor [Karaka Okahu purepure emaravirus]